MSNIALTKKLHDLSNEGKSDEIIAMADENIEVVAYAIGMNVKGQDAFRQFFMGFITAFPDLTIKHKNTFESGNQVCVEFDATGTHTGPLVGPGGTVPPTNRFVTFNVCEIHTWENGKLTRLVNYQDSASMLRQLGLM